MRFGRTGCWCLVVACWLAEAAGGLRGELILPPLFGDHAVLQSGEVVPVWGKAGPGEKVEVRYAGQVLATCADGDGRWQVVLAPMPAGICDTLRVEGSTLIERSDVVTGEVWVCSGQSNMAWRVEESLDAAREIAGADIPAIREFRVLNRPMSVPAEEFAAGHGGWVPATPRAAGSFTAAGYFFARELHRATGVPVGLLHAAWGGTALQPWAPERALRRWGGWQRMWESKRAEIAKWPERRQELDAALKEWRDQVAAAKAANQAPPPRPWQPAAPDAGQNMPALLYNGMIHPLTRYRIRGVLWYQGEANAGFGAGGAKAYAELQPLMVEGWREAWGIGNFPFYFVQLPGWSVKDDRTGETWAWFREGQAVARARTPNCGMVVAIDAGESDNIHPRNKQVVGTRLARLALSATYGRDIDGHAPELDAVVAEGGRVRVRLRNTGGGSVVPRSAVSGLELAGEDARFYGVAATAEGDELLIADPRVPRPRWIRYLWANDPAPTWFGRNGLPLAPFRTEIRQKSGG